MNWLIQFPRSEIQAVAALRTHPLEILDAPDCFWLRGTHLPETLRATLHALAATGRYFVEGEAHLIPWGKTVPAGKAPEGKWLPIAEALTLSLPAAHIPGVIPTRLSLRLKRSGAERPANMLLATLTEWSHFALHAPLFRLRGLSFALCTTHALIKGECLPPLRGIRYSEADGIAVPCGFSLTPIAESKILRNVLGLSEGDLALFQADSNYEVLNEAQFVAATRSNVRESAANSARAVP